MTGPRRREGSAPAGWTRAARSPSTIPLPEPSALAPAAAGTGRPIDGIGSDDTEQLAFQIHPREIPLTVHAVIQLDVGAVVPFQAYRVAAGL